MKLFMCLLYDKKQLDKKNKFFLRKIMNIFNIQNTITESFQNLSANRGYSISSDSLVKDYASDNLTCGVPDLDKLQLLLNGANDRLQNVLTDVNSALIIVENGIASAINIIGAGKQIIDGISNISTMI